MNLPTGGGFRLPNELLAVMLGFPSISELKEISLTCKSFRSLSLPRLFSTFRFKPFLNDFSAGTVPLSQIGVEKARETLHFFISPSICRYVRHCDVGPQYQLNFGALFSHNDDSDDDSDDSNDDSNDPASHVVLDEFFGVFSRLTNLRSLNFDNVPFTPKRLSQLDTIPHHTLSLNNCTLTSVQDIPRVRAQNVIFSFDLDPTNGRICQFWHRILDPSTLQHLEVSAEGETWQFFHPNMPTFPQLKKLRFKTDNDGTWFHLPALLTKFPVLADFIFVYPTDPSDTFSRRPIVADANNSKVPIQRFHGPFELLHVVANPELKFLSLDQRTLGLLPGDVAETLITESTGLKNLVFFTAGIQGFDADLFRAIQTHMPRLKALHLQVNSSSDKMDSLESMVCDALPDSLEHIYLQLRGAWDSLSCVERLMSHPCLRIICICSDNEDSFHLRKRSDPSKKWKDTREMIRDDLPPSSNRRIDDIRRWSSMEARQPPEIPIPDDYLS
ncbi:hypothetical protein H0H93_014129 [Arthromyces matolae]|nr:hypothetical protein H0H93_014129 [Arthromyces matolae]